MEKKLENVVSEMNDISAALKFLSEAIECHDSEGRSLNGGGMSYLARVLSDRVAKASDLCWDVKTSIEDARI
ncbi:hypothetical protein [Maridesulfovibrio frigidus]|uniref:hypothetical protein n=1 Tax=Maridesulfovibrio frigidus TaxID=340956 RepID=UPI0004E19C1A|nr:hypothetical protein [Maridesulfovibrio frigidus]